MLIQKHLSSDGEEDKNGLPTTDLFLLSVIAAQGATIGSDDHPGLACALAVQLMELRHALNLEPNTTSKFLVCSTSPKASNVNRYSSFTLGS